MNSLPGVSSSSNSVFEIHTQILDNHPILHHLFHYLFEAAVSKFHIALLLHYPN